MSIEEVIEISNFKFSSLRKYMHPIYSCLDRNLEESKERKKEILKEIVPEFYQRMRTYRGLTLDDVGRSSGFSVEELRAFEGKEAAPKLAMEMAYWRACHGLHEFEYFTQMVHEFFHPTVKGSKKDVAESAFIQEGVKIPGVDYKNLHGQRGKVLPFHK